RQAMDEGRIGGITERIAGADLAAPAVAEIAPNVGSTRLSVGPVDETFETLGHGEAVARDALDLTEQVAPGQLAAPFMREREHRHRAGHAGRAPAQHRGAEGQRLSLAVEEHVGG